MPELKVLTHIELQTGKAMTQYLCIQFTTSTRSREEDEAAEKPLSKAGLVAEVADGRTLRVCGVRRCDLRANGHRIAARTRWMNSWGNLSHSDMPPVERGDTGSLLPSLMQLFGGSQRREGVNTRAN
ncbi:hypothetical protein Asppvi_004585 [Aspergillus pseudoviridinutans]|uniref:Uncharacterized protein n=1 Tax=Aspergillus pseudoviridinutans TaxID=1517512 RepID=A0A9P3BAN0_9EURO|nr:uncharacterized protein Asppvi_004585 [Aspergillus pseudoviridinutans]GIJ85723.1 hypothetical protein Asppvi_004585 [Aspergillus pseudoviridinutans]